MSVLTPQDKDFPRWYQEVLSKAELAENGPVRGTMVIRPYGFSIWEQIQSRIDKRIKAAGAKSVYFPMLIPESYFRREAEHVDKFSPELAVVTYAGGKKLEEPLVIRPTSETIIGEHMRRWIQSYRDLPLMLNQWANVVRWELRPRVFLRNTEFLWQEGHTAHATQADAADYTATILETVQRDSLTNELAIPVICGIKTAKERFAGAMNSFSCEGMMRDGKALQLATSHEFGQNFAKAFDINFLDTDGKQKYVWTTSWGMSTRMMGGLIMVHGDDNGLVVPPVVAGTQVVVILVSDDTGVKDVANRIKDQLVENDIRVELDDRFDISFGRRSVDLEIKGIPIRVEVGLRDLAEGLVTLVRRDTREKRQLTIEAAALDVLSELTQVQTDLLRNAVARRDELIVDCTSLREAREAARSGWARIAWALVGTGGEDSLAEDGLTVRCLQNMDGSVPADSQDKDLVAVIARAY
ncbi:MAG: proline--tRNA ligase [Actinobacteria bacterium]|nr:proline--tRNA ligase [Actinomycetota bacterium]MCL6104721.1 proline--tRNA ligase [Actinomycetota bacterium]